MPRRFFHLIFVLTLAFNAVAWSRSAWAQTHPMDALTADEIRAAASVLKADPRTRDAVYQLITLKEPAKADVLAWRPAAR
jgi:Cu2+-containing amine oxidase